MIDLSHIIVSDDPDLRTFLVQYLIDCKVNFDKETEHGENLLFLIEKQNAIEYHSNYMLLHVLIVSQTSLMVKAPSPYMSPLGLLKKAGVNNWHQTSEQSIKDY